MKQDYNEAGAQAPATNKENLANGLQTTGDNSHRRGIHQTAFWRKQNKYRGTISWARY